MLKRILVPLDGSPLAEKALVQAGRLLRGSGTEVILTRVVEPVPLVPHHYIGLVPKLLSEAAEYLAQVADRLRKSGLQVRTVVGEGLAWEQIFEAAGREKATLVALTSHGRTGLSRWMLGSVAEKVIRGSPVPVLVLRSFETAPDGGASPTSEKELAFHKLLVPIDGGAGSLAALEPAAIVAKACGSSIVLVHVESRLEYPPGTYSAKLVDAPAKPPAGSIPEDAGKRLNHAGEILAARGLDVTTLRVGGDAASRIVDLPKELEADLIVMATHGRTGLSRFILGSVTEKVLRHSRLPMLIVPPAGDGA